MPLAGEVIIHVIWTKEVLSIFCLMVDLCLRIITYGHKNEKRENKYTICLKLYTFKVQPVINLSTFENPKKTFFIANYSNFNFQNRGFSIKKNSFFSIKKISIFFRLKRIPFFFRLKRILFFFRLKLIPFFSRYMYL